MSNYLSYGEFKNLVNSEISESNFNRLLPIASMKLDYITQDFYSFVNLQTDEVEYRKNKFKLAVALQIENMVKTEAETAAEAENKPIAKSQNIGGTSVSETYANRNSNVNNRYDPSISKEVEECLAGTGLLYKGVGYVRY